MGLATSSAEERDPLTYRIIGCAFATSRAFGPGLLESVYDDVMAFEMAKAGLSFARQDAIRVVHEGIRMQAGFRADFVVERRVILELKTVERLLPVHDAQLLTYLRLSGLHVGLLINFHAYPLTEGMKRLVL